MSAFDDLFLEHLGASLAKHLAFLHLVEGLPCNVDMDTGQAAFGDRYTFPVQMLGFEDTGKGAWTWGWALDPPAPAQLVREARKLKAYGESRNLDVFCVPSFETEDLDGDELALVACGLAGSESFFVAITDDESAFFLLPDLGGQLPQERPAHFLAEVIAEMLDTYTLPKPAAAIRPYLTQEGYEIDDQSPRRWTARHPKGRRLALSFDHQGRLVKLKASDGT